jgi:hypothetical protein
MELPNHWLEVLKRMMKMKALFLPLLLVGFTGALSAQTFDFDFTATGTGAGTGPYAASGVLTANFVGNLPGSGPEYQATSITGGTLVSPGNPSPGASIALLTPGSTPLLNDNFLFSSTGGGTFHASNQGIGFSDSNFNYLLNNIDGTDFLTQYPLNSNAPNFTDTVTFSSVTPAPWEPSDAVVAIGALLFGVQQFRKRRKVTA